MVSDGHVGTKKAVEPTFPEAKTQRRVVHFMTDVLPRVPRRLKKEVGAVLKAIFARESAVETRVKAGRVVEKRMEVLSPAMENPEIRGNANVKKVSCLIAEPVAKLAYVEELHASCRNFRSEKAAYQVTPP